MTTLVLAVLFSAVACTLSLAATTVVLNEDFEGLIGPEWSSDKTYITASSLSNEGVQNFVSVTRS